MVEMNGKILRDKKLIELKEKENELDCQLGLAVIQVGNDEASKVYVKQKEKIALELGYKFVHKVFKEDVEQDKLIRYIKKLNKEGDKLLNKNKEDAEATYNFYKSCLTII